MPVRPGPQDTDWRRIAELYARLLEVRPTAIVELNRAVAVAMAEGPDVGLGLIAKLRLRGDLANYYLLWAAEADLFRRLSRFTEAAASYRRALDLVTTDPERRFLQRRLAEVEGR